MVISCLMDMSLRTPAGVWTGRLKVEKLRFIGHKESTRLSWQNWWAAEESDIIEAKTKRTLPDMHKIDNHMELAKDLGNPKLGLCNNWEGREHMYTCGWTMLIWQIVQYCEASFQ